MVIQNSAQISAFESCILEARTLLPDWLDKMLPTWPFLVPKWMLSWYWRNTKECGDSTGNICRLSRKLDPICEHGFFCYSPISNTTPLFFNQVVFSFSNWLGKIYLKNEKEGTYRWMYRLGEELSTFSHILISPEKCKSHPSIMLWLIISLSIRIYKEESSWNLLTAAGCVTLSSFSCLSTPSEDFLFLFLLLDFIPWIESPTLYCKLLLTEKERKRENISLYWDF